MSIIGISGRIESGKDTVTKIIQLLTAKESFFKKMLFENLEDNLLNWKGNFDALGSFQNKKFADKLKDFICMLIGCTRKQLEDHDFKNRELGPEWWYWKEHITGKIIKPYNGHEINDYILVKHTPRSLMQIIGTECGRDIIHPNIWVNSLFADYRPNVIAPEGLISEDWESHWIISDMRFENEAEAVKKRGGLLIRVNRPCKECSQIDFHKMSCSLDVKEHFSETGLDKYTFDEVINNSGSLKQLTKKVEGILIKHKFL